jgi:ribosomal protein S18 acetylase RimI-like enzyme
MPNVIIRPAHAADIPKMAMLWHEKMILQQQSDRRLTLLPDALARWSAAAGQWLNNDCCRMNVALRGDEIVGYIIGWIQASSPGLSPERIGVVTDIAVGLHSYQSGLGRLLLDALRGWFCEQDIIQLIAHVPRRQPVEQAFWRALGATELTDVMWIK